jgi:hypothetical protein
MLAIIVIALLAVDAHLSDRDHLLTERVTALERQVTSKSRSAKASTVEPSEVRDTIVPLPAVISPAPDNRSPRIPSNLKTDTPASQLTVAEVGNTSLADTANPAFGVDGHADISMINGNLLVFAHDNSRMTAFGQQGDKLCGVYRRYEHDQDL